jgi:murein DD-endopeptidase MepM/ murein hydrolase activator NlpD
MLYCLILLLTTLVINLTGNAEVVPVSGENNTYIKWIDFNVTKEALADAVKIDIDTYGNDNHVDFIELLSLLSVKYGGEFKRYKKADVEAFTEKLKNGDDPRDITANQKLYDYYFKAYTAVLGGMVGEYAVKSDYETTGLYYEKRYGLKAFSPIAAGYYYNHYDDFGASRSYGYRRRHLGHDMMGSVGTPIIAIESGYVEACGWNQYGGWRIGIRSFDGKRYYYYAHLRRGHPYNDIYEGKIIDAGEVIGYLGMTGYSTKEDTNNINVPHLHVGLQIIFDTSQKDGVNQIWLDMYELTNFLAKNRAEVAYDKETKEHYSKNSIIDLSSPD